MKEFFRIVSLVTVCVGFITAAFAQDVWPSKPIKLIVPFSAGGSTDIVARVLAQRLTERIGQPVVVENKPGAGGTIGAAFARSQPSDGYTRFLGTVSTQSVAPFLYAKLPYDPLKDFTALTMIATVPNVVVVNKSIPATTLQQFTALAKSKPGKLSYGSSGKGASNHLATEGLSSRLGIQVVHVPYKGSGPALMDTMAGHVDFMLDVVLTSLPYIKKGDLRAIAVTSNKRIPVLPDVPTVAEQGYPGFEAIGWFGLFAPSALPAQLRKRIATELIAVIRSKDMDTFLESQGAQPSGIEPEEFERVVAADRAKWGQVAKATGVVPE